MKNRVKFILLRGFCYDLFNKSRADRSGETPPTYNNAFFVSKIALIQQKISVIYMCGSKMGEKCGKGVLLYSLSFLF